jgi:hypothetical protein
MASFQSSPGAKGQLILTKLPARVHVRRAPHNAGIPECPNLARLGRRTVRLHPANGDRGSICAELFQIIVAESAWRLEFPWWCYSYGVGRQSAALNLDQTANSDNPKNSIGSWWRNAAICARSCTVASQREARLPTRLQVHTRFRKNQPTRHSGLMSGFQSKHSVKCWPPKRLSPR